MQRHARHTHTHTHTHTHARTRTHTYSHALPRTYSFARSHTATLTMTKVSKSSDKSMITELLTKALPYINDERVATERKWLSHIFDLVGSGGDLLQFGLDEVQRSLTGGALREVYMQRRVVDDHLDVVDSAVANGCDLKIVETAGLLDDYGGAVGVLWF
eukprot:TRINITY_DN1611_c0_g1_i2.p1 TRINITY_DN1611_c0_g1~~TRINITY_DN1611_c0_g1_i2.p1  ORF type:complete len:159 (+),score=44.07 TRINITY_DN1611_c0_g1_i2:407-883(+)